MKYHPFRINKDQKAIIVKALCLAINQLGRKRFAKSLIQHMKKIIRAVIASALLVACMPAFAATEIEDGGTVKLANHHRSRFKLPFPDIAVIIPPSFVGVVETSGDTVYIIPSELTEAYIIFINNKNYNALSVHLVVTDEPAGAADLVVRGASNAKN
ncbi:hypothetical protein ICN48_06680 [Polynucleobacter sp. JS-Safj-400b-B2]|uniref:hypothetical protein n=1 Tax=Polynucleobacter sp. JS-Safj-400b-B2 TaxID=2576921 RepID=UPI001C0C002B|nr:hypothetical protein [Polynucleobacter sp. JS-Safj-400b-B2]MBU3625918.1 hypothetical protein [Polynucleobacter sp. JS-Safj-400b-B2]